MLRLLEIFYVALIASAITLYLNEVYGCCSALKAFVCHSHIVRDREEEEAVLRRELALSSRRPERRRPPRSVSLRARPLVFARSSTSSTSSSCPTHPLRPLRSTTPSRSPPRPSSLRRRRSRKRPRRPRGRPRNREWRSDRPSWSVRGRVRRYRLRRSRKRRTCERRRTTRWRRRTSASRASTTAPPPSSATAARSTSGATSRSSLFEPRINSPSIATVSTRTLTKCYLLSRFCCTISEQQFGNFRMSTTPNQIHSTCDKPKGKAKNRLDKMPS